MATLEQRTRAALDTFYQTGSKAAAGAAFVFPSSMSWAGGRYGASYSSVAPRGTLWRNADPSENSAVMNTIAWITRNFGQAEFQVCKKNAKGDEVCIENHPVADLVCRPNPWYGAHTLWAATLISYHFDGNAYWIKVRNARGFGVPTELWYVPHWAIRPHWPLDGSAYIDYYEYHVNGQIQKVDPKNVIHFRQGLNPANTRVGISPLKAALLEVFTDQEVNAWVAALCRNMAIPGVVINPKAAIGMTSEKADQIKQTWKRKFGGDNRGEPLILDFEADISAMGYNPKDMDFAAIHHHAESRIAGALGVPPPLTFLDVANKSSSFNNLTTFERIGWEQGIVPVYENFEDTLDAQLLPDFERDPVGQGIFTEFDCDDVRALKEAQGEKEQRIRDRVTAGLMTVAAAQAELGMTPDPQADYYLIPSNATPRTSAIAAEMAGEKPQPPQPPTTEPQPRPNETQPATEPPAGKRLEGRALPLLPPAVKAAVEWNGLNLSREPSALEQMCIKQIDELMTDGAASIDAILQRIRATWANQLATDLDEADPGDYGDVTVNPPATERQNLILAAIALFTRAAALVLAELAKQGGAPEGKPATTDAESIAPLVDTMLSRMRAETIARAVYSAGQAILTGASVGDRIRQDFAAGSLAYVDQIAAETSNAIIARGRAAEQKARGAQIDFLIYSAVLDTNSCQPCALADGQTGQINTIPDVPNPDCKGGARCRCIHIAALAPEA